MPAHPRSRGENVAYSDVRSVYAGSSPLTRGKLRRRNVRARPARLIPAHAGKTVALRYRRTRLPAHPRSRGENVVADTKKFSRAGSSPLTRGKLLDRRVGLALQRLIPAHAGKTASAGTQPESRAAHPRSRGENRLEFAAQEGNNGSSPLTRGKRPNRSAQIGGTRLIPAHAGKTRCDRRRGRSYGAHPRSRGENYALEGVLCGLAGSSPLTRGKRCPLLVGQRGERLIPAHAGKTTTLLGTLAASRAHPRSRGENTYRGGRSASRCGSSPLTRGKRPAGRHEAYPDRLIPAHAGKTSRRRS